MLPRNPLADKSIDQTMMLYKLDSEKTEKPVKAHAEDGSSVPLKEAGFANVEFIAGLWRIQRKFDNEIIKVSDVLQKNIHYFILDKERSVKESNQFTYYAASMVYPNCYGWQKSQGGYIVAKHEVFGDVHWSYEKNLEASRAFMGNRNSYIFQEPIQLLANADKTWYKRILASAFLRLLGAKKAPMTRLKERSRNRAR